MKPINIEKLLSHSIGISNSYYRPTESELLDDYLKVSDILLIDKQEKFQKELHKYEQKSQEESYVIRGKLQEKDEEIKYLREKDKIKEDSISNLSNQLIIISQRLNQLKKTKEFF